MDSQHQAYQPVAPEEESEKLLDGDGENANATPLPEPQRKRRRCEGISSLCWWLSNVILLILVAYLAFFPPRSAPTDLVAKLELAGDVNGIPPRFSQQIVEFDKDVRFVGNLSSPTFKNDTREQWLGLVPKGLGFVEIKNPEKYPWLPEPYIKYNKTVYTTSVTHQLHCLYMLMHGFNDVINLGYLTMPDEGEDPFDHLSHCFDYLRQAIMCHGDTALEGLQHSFGPDVGGSDGWGVQHVCKRYDEVYNWLEKMRIDDRVWI